MLLAGFSWSAILAWGCLPGGGAGCAQVADGTALGSIAPAMPSADLPDAPDTPYWHKTKRLSLALLLLWLLVTLGVGLVGGEVTPLFVIGATLGVTLAGPLGLPPEQAACAALAALFGACASAPLALLCMVVELCGAGAIAQQLVTIVMASVVVGGRSIYTRPR